MAAKRTVLMKKSGFPKSFFPNPRFIVLWVLHLTKHPPNQPGSRKRYPFRTKRLFKKQAKLERFIAYCYRKHLNSMGFHVTQNPQTDSPNMRYNANTCANNFASIAPAKCGWRNAHFNPKGRATMTNKDLLSVAECARRLGISRQRLSKLLDDAGIEKKRVGKDALVSFPDAQQVVQIAAAQNKVRTPKAHKNAHTNAHTNAQSLAEESQLVSILREQIAELKTERERLLDKVESLIHLESEVKLLKAAKEHLEEKVEKADRSLVSRIGKAINAFKD
jgi:hypothetical protein